MPKVNFCGDRRSSRSVLIHRVPHRIVLVVTVSGVATEPFEALSPQDFEDLCCDILQERTQSHDRVETFTTGRDDGIDLRVIGVAAAPKVTVGQCKHYHKSGYSKLKSSIKKEREKVVALKLQRYVLFASVGLTPANKRELVSVLHGVPISVADIWGSTEISAFLRQRPEIKRRHHKLWLSGVAVLQEVINGGVTTRTRAHVKEAREKSKIYVQSASYDKAAEKLNNGNVCIVSGAPGVGKSTLADALLLDLVAKRFAPVVVSEDIDEADRLWTEGARQVFLYDDFLGRASVLESLGKNEDDRLLRFIRRVRADPHKRLIMTTREYIIRQAQELYERLDSSHVDVGKLTVELSDHDRMQRARVLYNHLYFAGIRGDDLKKFLAEQIYHQVIDHPNYVPRLIDDAVSLYLTREREDVSFAEFIVDALDSPASLWRHVLEKRYDTDGQFILVCLLALNLPAKAVAVRGLYTRARPEGGSFDSVLRSLEGSVLSVAGVGDDARLDFLNPGVQDSTLLWLGRRDSLVNLLIQHHTSFAGLVLLWGLARGGIGSDYSRPSVPLFGYGGVKLPPMASGELPSYDCLKRLGASYVSKLFELFESSFARPSEGFGRLEQIVRVAVDLKVDLSAYPWLERVNFLYSDRLWYRPFSDALSLARQFAQSQSSHLRPAFLAIVGHLSEVVAGTPAGTTEFQNKFDLLDLIKDAEMEDQQKVLVGVTMEELEDQFSDYIEDGIWEILQEDDHQSASENLDALETLSGAFGLYIDLDEARDHVSALEDDYEPDPGDRLEQTLGADEPDDGGAEGEDPVDLLFAGLDEE